MHDLNKYPKVTVLMPVYNGQAFLAEAIDSILKQTFTDFELLIINDGSTDESLSIIRSFQDPRIRLIHHETNLKLIATLNEGLILAQGEYIARMDADDIAHPERLAKQVNYLEEHPDIQILGSVFQYFGEAITQHWVQKNPLEYQQIRASFLFYCALNHPSIMMRSRFITQHQLRYDPAYLHAEDYELWSRAAELGKIANFPEPLLQYRLHPDQICNSTTPQQEQAVKRIQQRLLKAMGIPVDQEMLDFHTALVTKRFGNQNSIEVQHRALNWFNLLLETNQKSGFYDPEALRYVLCIRWQRLFRDAPSLRAWWLHQQSPFKHVKLTHRDQDPGSKNMGFWISLRHDLKSLSGV